MASDGEWVRFSGEDREVLTTTSASRRNGHHSDCRGLLTISYDDLIKPEWRGKKAICVCFCHVAAGSGN